MPKGQINERLEQMNLIEKDGKLNADTLAGAIAAFEFNATMNQRLIVETLIMTKETKLHLKLGFSNWETMVEQKFRMSRTKAYDLIDLQKKVGLHPFLALQNIGLKKSEIKVLGAAASDQEVKINQDEKEPPAIQFEDRTIPVDGDHIREIQDVIRVLKTEKEEAAKAAKNLTEKIDEYKRLESLSAPEIEKFLQDKEIEIRTYFGPFYQLKEAIVKTPKMRKVFEGSVIKIEKIVDNIKSELLDEILTPEE